MASNKLFRFFILIHCCLGCRALIAQTNNSFQKSLFGKCLTQEHNLRHFQLLRASGDENQEDKSIESNNERWRHKAIRLQEEDAAEVMQLNSNFYTTMTDRDMRVMARIWQQDDIVQCLHPGLPLTQGYDSIMKVFRKMFNSRDAKQHKIVFKPKQVKVHVRGNSAWVSCIEDAVVVAQGSHLQYKMCATNIFRKVGKRWYMIHHHTSPYPSSSTGTSSSYTSGGNAMTIGNMLMSRLGNNLPNGTRVFHIRPREGNQSQVIYDLGEQKDDESKEENNNSTIELGESYRIIGSGDKNGTDSDSMEARIRAAVQENANDMKNDDRDLTRRTVAAVRDIWAKGKISNGEKRLLLMDVIRNAASENPSMTEVAYELLIGGASLSKEQVDDDALNEFVEQCKVFAADISTEDLEL